MSKRTFKQQREIDRARKDAKVAKRPYRYMGPAANLEGRNQRKLKHAVTGGSFR